MTITNAQFTTIAGHSFANCIFIFHKTEFQTVILRCLTGLNLNWFKSYGLRCSERPCECSVNLKNVATDKWPFYDHVWPFFAKYMVNFHKTEIQTVILRCLTGLNLDWFKSYDSKCKYFHFGFLWYCRKKCICVFCFLGFHLHFVS